MKTRCNNKNKDSYKNYWWRWIKYDKKWETFLWFFEDMWENYQEWLTLDRIDNNWNYCKENCRWIIHKKNCNNRNTCIIYNWLSLTEWCEKIWLKYNTVKARIWVLWWEIEKAIWINNENWEQQYLELWRKILNEWGLRETRNSKTKSLFWLKLQINCLEDWFFPLVTTRKMFPKSFIWEYAAFLRWPKHLKDFEQFWCNYWKLWAEKDWKINVDYWNEWLNSNWTNQIDYVLNLLKNDNSSRRMIINAWNPSHIWKLSLECCHYAYQFYVRNWKLDLLWHQRSADFMVWVPSDIWLAALMNLTFAKESWLLPWRITMIFWDTHIYESHIEKAKEQIERKIKIPPKFEYNNLNSIYDFIPENINIIDYDHHEKINYDLIW